MNTGRERQEIIYSIVIIIAIPLLFVVNTVLLTSRVSNDSDRNIRRNADLVNGVIAESLRTSITLKNYKLTNTEIANLKKREPNITSVYVAGRDNNEYSIVAKAADAPAKLAQNDRLQLSIIFDRSRSVAKRVETKNAAGDAVKGWNVITPLLDDNDKVVAAVSSTVLTSDTEELIDNTLTTSFIATGVSVLIIVGLLIHHLRYVRYADMLRRQREVNQMMGDFLSVATHELRAPMSIIKGYIENVLDGIYGEVNEKIRQPLSTAVTQTDRLNAMVEDLLNVSRIEQGKMTIEPKNVDIGAVVGTLFSNYELRAKEKGLTLVHDSTTPVMVYADPGRVQEIMTNLIDNAYKYTPSGTITVKHTVKGAKIITSVVDTGPGMTADESSRLFQRFYRVRNENTKDIPGTGLGLWIIKQYAEKMGGTITVSSIVGVGTEFSVELPAGSPELDQAPPQAASHPPSDAASEPQSDASSHPQNDATAQGDATDKSDTTPPSA